MSGLNNRGSALRGLDRRPRRLPAMTSAGDQSEDAAALYNRGNALQDLGRDAEALDSYDQVLAIRPDYVEPQQPWQRAARSQTPCRGAGQL